ncbi:MAG TPA: hypothetical protein VK843_04645 [Planctomycetota bacterium]|nr:hypothetical protein [Planctomycetota bacterium]
MRWLGRLFAGLDRAIDAAVRAMGAATVMTGSLVRLTNTGRVQQYLAFALLGLIAAAALLILG